MNDSRYRLVVQRSPKKEDGEGAPATPTRDEQVAAAIQEVMEQKDEQGVYIFQSFVMMAL